MKRCWWCRGLGFVVDLTWCGKNCCPRDLRCLKCGGSGVRPKK